MPRKTRILTLRISEQEFETLKVLYAAHGARNVSEFVRSAMNRLISDMCPNQFTLELKVQEIDGRLSVLSGEVARLSELLKNVYTNERL